MGNGSGSNVDDLYESDSYSSYDRANTETTFYESDIDELEVGWRRKRQLKRSLRWNEGADYVGGVKDQSAISRKRQNREDWKRRLVLTYAANIDLSKRQKQRCEHIMTDVVSVASFGPYSSEKVALGIAVAVARENGRQVSTENDFDELMYAVDLITEDDEPNYAKLDSLVGLVRERVPSMSE